MSRYLLKAANAGNREAQFLCGDLYQDEEKSGVFDEEKAMYRYRKAAEQGDAEAAYLFALAYQYGYGEENQG